MHTTTKMKLLALLALGSLAMPALAQNTQIADIQKGAEDVAKAMARALPFNSTVGLNWSDAYIGQLLSLPPHFGVGIVGGMTTLDSADMTGILESMGGDLGDIPEKLPFPAMAAEGRIGGFILPFDLGLKVGFIPGPLADSIKDVTLDYFLVGGDVRYALFKGGLILPKVSVGFGINHLSGAFGTTVSGGQAFDLPGGNTLKATDPEIGFEWENTTFELKAQVSKSLLIITPYAGLGAAYGRSTAGYYLKSDVLYNDNPIGPAQVTEIKQLLTNAGITPPDVSATGMSSSYDVSGWAIRAFGGLSLNMLVLKFDLTGMYNLTDGNYGASLGLRLQL